MSKELNPKQIKFCQEYVLNGNATQSYIDAGYSEKGAQPSSSALLLNPIIQEYIEELKKEAQESFKIDREWLFQGYKELIELHKDITPAVAKGSYDSIGKLLGLNEADKVDVTSKGEALGGFKIVVDDGTEGN